MLRGKAPALDGWGHLDAFVRLVTRPEQLDEALEQVRDLWRKHQDHDRQFGRETSVPGQQELACHFARGALGQWGSQAGKLPGRWDAQIVHLEGSFAVMAHEFDTNTTGKRVYDDDFQTEILQHLEWGDLRGSMRVTAIDLAFRPTSFVMYGRLLPQHSRRTPPAIVAIEVHDRGVVSVFFREEVTNATLGEAIAWWIFGSASTTAFIHSRLGSRGPADAAVVLDGGGLSDVDVELEWPEPIDVEWRWPFTMTTTLTDMDLPAPYRSNFGRYLESSFPGLCLAAFPGDRRPGGGVEKAWAFARGWATELTDQVWSELLPDADQGGWNAIHGRLFKTHGVRAKEQSL